jgi:CheY-like chemotaxis protein
LRRILVIAEEALVRDGLQRVLTATSTVVTAGDAAQGLSLLRESPTDLVIIDVASPATDGVAAIREIRRDYPDTRVIAISGGGGSGLSSYRPDAISTNAYLAACSVAGAHGTMAKPFETGELRELIDRVFAAPAG